MPKKKTETAVADEKVVKKSTEVATDDAVAEVDENETPHPSPAVTPSPQGEGFDVGDSSARIVQDAEDLSAQDVGDVSGEKPAEAVDKGMPVPKKEKEEYVEFCLPFVPGKEMGDFQTVTLNGRNYQVQYGVTQKIPLGVKEILEDMLLSQRLIKRKIDELTKEEKCIAKFED